MNDQEIAAKLGITNSINAGMVSPNLGILTFRMPNGEIRKFQGNRAQRRRFIRVNKIVRSKL